MSVDNAAQIPADERVHEALSGESAEHINVIEVMEPSQAPNMADDEKSKDEKKDLCTDPSRQEELAVEKKREDEETKEDRPAASLWCPVDGHPHSQVYNIGCFVCKDCKQDLRKSDAETSAFDKAYDSDTDSDDEGGAVLPMRPIGDIDYQVEYWSPGEQVSHSTRWPNAFDLDEARGGVVMNSAVFSARIGVSTSIPRDEIAPRYGPRRANLFETALKDPAVFMAVKRTAVTIRSVPLVRVLKSVISYYPQVSLDSLNPSVELNEPYALICHHLDELEAFRSKNQPTVDIQAHINADLNMKSEGLPAAKDRIPAKLEAAIETVQPQDEHQKNSNAKGEDQPENSELVHGARDRSLGKANKGTEGSSGTEGPSSDEAKPKTPQESSAIHLGLLLDFLNDRFQLKGKIAEERARHQQSPATCTFRMAWLLFKPGTTVYVQDGHARVSAKVVQAVEVDNGILSSTEGYISPLQIKLWSLDFDGRVVGRQSSTISIPNFDGERLVTSLQAFPCEFLDRTDGGETRTMLEAHGLRWYGLLKGGLVHYDGEFLGGEARTYNGRVFVDNTSYFQSGQPGVRVPVVGRINDMWPGLPDEFGDVQVALPPPGPPHPPPSRPGSLTSPYTVVPGRFPGTLLGTPSLNQLGNTRCSCELCQGRRPHPPPGFRWSEYDGIDPTTQESLELSTGKEPPLHRYLLCPGELKGLALKTRKWETLNIALCLPPKRNIRAIDSLVMPEDRKVLIRALVNKFNTQHEMKGPLKQWRADWIENKGEGQIFLLHGSPGVGKTFTAECIAEYTRRPLISLTSGDIGTNETRAEERLSTWFELAEKWGAVMLLDEADVFLEKRQISDLARNSLVSVFLRAVEYYRGILFLTTNRVGHFDDAFMSRIHVVIAYENLGEKERRQIWRQLFGKLADERKDIYIDPRAKKYVLDGPDMRDIEWNGREIRNAFQTAVALAEYRFAENKEHEDGDMITLDQTDFERVCEMTISFKKYLTNVHGGDESARAYISKARLDHDMD